MVQNKAHLSEGIISLNSDEEKEGTYIIFPAIVTNVMNAINVKWLQIMFLIFETMLLDNIQISITGVRILRFCDTSMES